MNTSTAISGALLVLSGQGVRVGVLGHYPLAPARVAELIKEITCH